MIGHNYVFIQYYKWEMIWDFIPEFIDYFSWFG